MNLNRVVISCFKRDVYLLRACVGSLKYWYPEIEIYLLKDTHAGAFSTKEIEREYGATVITFPLKYYGWGYSKISCLINFKGRYLLLDSDTIVLGKVLDKFMGVEDDFIVTGYKSTNKSDALNSHYYNFQKIDSIDPSFEFPGYGINTGQLVATGNIIHESDIDPLLIQENGKIKEKYPGAFPHADQGIINYVLARKKKEGKATVQYCDFWIWPGVSETENISFKSIADKQGVPYVLHWAGIKPIDFRRLKRYDFFEFFEREYYKKIKFGGFIRLYRRAKLIAYINIKILSYKLRRLDYPK